MAKKAKKLQVVEGEFYEVKNEGVLKCTKGTDEKGNITFHSGVQVDVKAVVGKVDYQQYKEHQDKVMDKLGISFTLSPTSRAFLEKQAQDGSMLDVVRGILANQKIMDNSEHIWVEIFKMADAVGLYYKVCDALAYLDAHVLTPA